MCKLPNQNNINIEALSSLFQKTNTSYKYLLFQAILSLLDEYDFKESKFSFAILELKMLEIAEYPIKICRLNFGSDDRVANKLFNKFYNKNLIQYPLYRLLSPFFEGQISGLDKTAKENKIAELSNEPLKYNAIYKITKTSIIINPEWLIYLQMNFAIIKSWSLWHWVNYLQKKNPNTVALINKLQKPSERFSLKKQTKYWQTILNKQPMRCIFSGNEITPSNLSLDHFLPWSFVGHDQLWNLIPMPKNDNSAKRDNIPSMKKYLEKFINTQKTGLEIAYNEMGKDQWQNTVGDFATDFKMEFSDLRKPNTEVFTSKYKEIILPLSTIAKNNGFDCHWVY